MDGLTRRAGEKCNITSFRSVKHPSPSPFPFSHSINIPLLITQLLINPHWLLTALLLVNAAAYETLPIFLDRLLNPFAAILISVSAILLFGEIAPQAVCRRYSLHVGAYCSWLVRVVMIVTAPISWPLGKCLDWLLGEETVLFRRPELRELVALHAEPDEDGGESMLTREEVQVIHGALDMAHKTAETAMTSLANVFAVDADAVVEKPLLEKIIAVGHSRIPVYEGSDKRNIIGLILVKELILRDTTRSMKVRDCVLLRNVDFIVADTPLYSVMELFRLKRRHMAVLTRPESTITTSSDDVETLPTQGNNTDTSPNEALMSPSSISLPPPALPLPRPSSPPPLPPNAMDVVGIITIEDVIEELLNVEIVDETDVFIDNEQTERVRPNAGTDLPPTLTKYLSLKKKGQNVVSARPSPNKSPTLNSNQSAIVAAAAGAAYAAARTQKSGSTVGGLSHRRAQSEVLLAPLQTGNGVPLQPPAAGGGGVGGQLGGDTTGLRRPNSSML